MDPAPLREFETGVALVAGGSGGIGAAICEDLARAGANVALTYRSNAAAGEAAARAVRRHGREAEAVAVDLCDAKAVKAFADAAAARYGRIHSVVYAAGPPLEMAYISEIDPDTWAATLRADIEGCFNLVWAALPHVKRQGGGGAFVAVVTAAVDRPPPKDILSAAPKAAIQALMRGLAGEEGRFGIRANCVGPGWIDAGLGAAIMSRGDQSGYVDKFTAGIPLKRLGQAEEIAGAVTFLLSDQARYITGATVPVAGGLQL